MHILCETSGMVLWGERSTDPRQPHIVEAAAALIDTETRKTVSSLHLIACPAGWQIPKEVVAIHGITTERAKALGLPERIIIEALLGLWAKADIRIAHNESFDARIARIAIKRYIDEDTADYWKAGKAECTARLAGPIMALAPTERMLATGRTHYKTPNLIEAYKHFCGKVLKNAHSAAVDVKACRDVWFAIKRQAETHPQGSRTERDAPFI